jgi:chromosome segregation ATPase
MYFSEHGRTFIGWLATVGGSFAAIAQDRIGGFTLSGVIAAVTGMAGAALLIYDNARSKARENRKKDLEIKLEEQRRLTEQEIELEGRRREAAAKADKEYRTGFRGQIDRLTAQIDDLKTDMKEQSEQHRQDIKVREDYQAELLTALTAARENQEQFRRTNDHLVKQLESANRHVAALESKLGELVRTTATKEQAAAIESKVEHIRTGGSRDEIPIPPDPQ